MVKGFTDASIIDRRHSFLKFGGYMVLATSTPLPYDNDIEI
jgi:hypothetical protein